MNAADLIAALDLPASAQVERRVPKKLLLENGAPTAADKRHINDGIEELFWIAALKPTTIGVPEYRDPEREYLEIAVLRFTLRAGAKTTRLVELVHRAVPYPLLLLTEHAGQLVFSAAHKRWAQNEAEKTVLDGDVVAADWEVGSEAPQLEEFRKALALERQPHGTLRALYQGWVDTLVAFKAARLTGSFTPAADQERATARQDALRECSRLETEMTRLRAAAGKEKQMARRVELNRQISFLSNQLTEQRALL
ncbi:DUF4391 domain-containing protein [Candidatus Nitrospira nitrificans]|uniref:Methyl-accepting chemotaxis protein n=1 Tax=Candidatus Nitrospira nitrificans TaxID=1742973 RepID=A0A0S4LJG5_9BACT|nr:DUF4391 domain-containing protein [Candidatus Nitrospira nitrificans]CUS37653.1 conserved hypothetical protein [Candidatus Nitrospira nitrificans]